MTIKTIGISDLRKDISAKVKEVCEQHTRYIIVQRSSPKAVLLSLEELEALEGMTDGKRRNETEGPAEDVDSGQDVCYEDFFLKKLADRLK